VTPDLALHLNHRFFHNRWSLCLRWVNFKLSLVGQFYIAGDTQEADLASQHFFIATSKQIDIYHSFKIAENTLTGSVLLLAANKDYEIARTSVACSL